MTVFPHFLQIPIYFLFPPRFFSFFVSFSFSFFFSGKAKKLPLTFVLFSIQVLQGNKVLGTQGDFEKSTNITSAGNDG